MLALVLPAICASAGSSRLFVPRGPFMPSRTSAAARSQEPMMPLFDFGTANFDAPEGKKKSFFIGVEREDDEPQPNKFSKSGEDVVNINPIPLLLAGTPFVLILTFIVSLFLLTPGKQLPFNFLDGANPLRQEELRVIEVKKTKIAAEEKAAKEKAKAAAEAKAKAAEEAAKAEAAKAPAKK